MKKLLNIIGYVTIALVCSAAVAGAGYYMFAPKFANSAKGAASKGEGQAEKEGDHDEGVKLTDAQIAAAGIELLTAGPRELRDTLRLNGTIQPNQEALVKVTPRFPGVIRSMRKRLGDKVKRDEVLATIESNQSLTTYELKAPIDGTVIDRDGTLGEFASETKPIFTIADLSTMWIDFAVYRSDFGRVRLGDPVSIDVDDGGPTIEAKIDYLSPIGASDTQSAIARAVVRNDGRLRPGLFVMGRVVLSARPVDVAVRTSALQTLEGKTVVFVRDGEKFVPRSVELGGRDADWIEITFGLTAGDVYAAKNSFVVKAEIGKAGAEHEH
jgi:cobalt-zinc-cadmium efflux system membrane fusion protein